MKKMALIAAAAGLAAACAFAAGRLAAGKPADKRLDRSKLLIGAYYLQPNARSEAHVKAVRDCGVDFICGLAASQRETLDLFHKYGIGAIALGVVPGWGGGAFRKCASCRENGKQRRQCKRFRLFYCGIIANPQQTGRRGQPLTPGQAAKRPAASFL